MENMPAPPTQRRSYIALVALLAVGLVAGFAVGGAAANPPAAAPATVTAPPEIQTNNIEVKVTPQSCLDALDSAETIFNYAARGFGAASRGFNAASRLDVAGIVAANNDMNAAAKLVGTETGSWKRARDACRNSA